MRYGTYMEGMEMQYERMSECESDTPTVRMIDWVYLVDGWCVLWTRVTTSIEQRMDESDCVPQ